MQTARESFDFIVIDADPITVEPFTRFVVLSADVAVVVAKAGSTLFNDLLLVVNEVRKFPIGAMTGLLNCASDLGKVTVQQRLQSAIVWLSWSAKQILGRINGRN
jgi:MinD superfamily P-loop ATPase